MTKEQQAVLGRLEAVYAGVMSDERGRVPVSRDLIFDAMKAIRASDRPAAWLPVGDQWMNGDAEQIRQQLFYDLENVLMSINTLVDAARLSGGNQGAMEPAKAPSASEAL